MSPTLLDIVIPGPPVGWQAPFVGKRGAFKPSKSTEWQAGAVFLISNAWHDVPYDAPVAIQIALIIQRPKRLMRKKDPDGRMCAAVKGCGSKPDWDNASKLACDAIVRAGVLKDDTLIVSAVVDKVYTAKEGDQPHTFIRVESVGDGYCPPYIQVYHQEVP